MAALRINRPKRETILLDLGPCSPIPLSMFRRLALYAWREEHGRLPRPAKRGLHPEPHCQREATFR